jgi:hypothetical protein
MLALSYPWARKVARAASIIAASFASRTGAGGFAIEISTAGLPLLTTAPLTIRRGGKRLQGAWPNRCNRAAFTFR